MKVRLEHEPLQEKKWTTTIQLENAAEGLSLFGPNDSFLRLIQKHTPAHIVARNETITLTGTKEQVDKLQRLFVVLLKLIRQGFHLSETNIAYAMELVERQMEEELLDLYSEEIGQTYRGKAVRVKTLGQRLYVSAIRKRDVIFGIGPAGTGKTFLAVVMAVQALKAGSVKKIVLVRPAVEAGESLGFLPGDLQEKVDPYLRPLYDSLYEMLGADQVNKFMERGMIEVAPLAYMRGRTLNDAFVILDEAQNTTPEQMKMFLTRLGFGSKMVITGDITQIDLPKGKKSGLVEAEQILRHIEEIAFVYLKQEDVVRHMLVQKIIEAYEKSEHTIS